MRFLPWANAANEALLRQMDQLSRDVNIGRSPLMTLICEERRRAFRLSHNACLVWIV
ncbi:MAG: hypothetical protein U0X91_21750 [Spirosomataceae bacterium]